MRIKPLDFLQLAVTVYGLFRKKPSETAELISSTVEARSQAAGYEWARAKVMDENLPLVSVRKALYHTNVGASFETGALEYLNTFESFSTKAPKEIKMHSTLSETLEPTEPTDETR